MLTEEIDQLQIIMKFLGDNSTCGPSFNDAIFENVIDYNYLHKAWNKFKTLNFYGHEYCSAYSHRHRYFVFIISSKLVNGTQREAFNELVEGVKWYLSIK